MSSSKGSSSGAGGEHTRHSVSHADQDVLVPRVVEVCVCAAVLLLARPGRRATRQNRRRLLPSVATPAAAAAGGAQGARHGSSGIRGAKGFQGVAPQQRIQRAALLQQRLEVVGQLLGPPRLLLLVLLLLLLFLVLLLRLRHLPIGGT